MRLRFKIELHISRDKPGQPETVEPPYVADGPESLVERADPTPIGFTIDMPNHDD